MTARSSCKKWSRFETLQSSEFHFSLDSCSGLEIEQFVFPSFCTEVDVSQAATETLATFEARNS